MNESNNSMQEERTTIKTTGDDQLADSTPRGDGPVSPGRRTRRGEITSTYRAMYGGPQGASVSTWRSKESAHEQQNQLDDETDHVDRMLEEHGRVDETKDGSDDDDSMVSSSSLHKALKDISVLTTGQILKHRDAMESLVGILETHTTSVEMMKEIHMQGGTHVLYTNIQSSDKAVRNLSAEGLACVCMNEKEALDEVVSSRDISSAILGTCVRDVLTSQSTAHEKLFDVLVQSKSRAIQQCCAEHKVVLKCIERLQARAKKPGDIDHHALHMLYTMLDTGLEYYSNSVFWNGGLEVLVLLIPILSSEHNKDTESVEKVVCMMSRVCHDAPEATESLCTSEAVECLSCMIADPDISVDVQLMVARILLDIARVSKKRHEVIVSLQDYCLPRVCEVVHQSKAHELSEESTTEYDLWTTCAGIVSYLSRDSHVCCQVVIFHADILQQSIRLLTRSFKYEQTRVLLDSAMTFAVNM